MDWLAESPEGTNVKCKLCKKVPKILNMAKDTLRSYAHSERQKQEMNIFRGIQLFFDKACMKSSLTSLIQLKELVSLLELDQVVQVAQQWY